MIKPLNGWMLVKEIEKPEVSKSGIILKSDVPERSITCEIVDMGTVSGDETEVKVGDKVVFDKEQGQQAKMLDGDFWLVKYEDVLAVCE